MEQEQTNQNQSPSKAGETKNSSPGQALLALGSRECDQFFLEDENRFIVKKPVHLTKFFTSISRQIYTVACGALHTVLLTTNGEVYTFGCNDDGALGRAGNENEPIKVDLEVPVDMISAGDSHSVACNSGLSFVYHWGVYRNTSKGNISKSETPHRIGEDEFKKKKIKRVLSGANHTLVLADGKIYAWGDAEVGILGRLPTSRRKFDQGLKIEGMGVRGHVDEIYTGAYHAFLKKTEKKKEHKETKTYTGIFAWGLNNCGQLGIGNTDNQHLPVEIPALRDKNIKNITGGEHHTIVLTEEGEVYSFGKNDDGQLGLGQDFEEKEESEPEEAEEEVKKTPVKKPPPPKSSKKGKGKKGGSQKKGQENGEDKAEEKEETEKKEEEKEGEREKEGEKENGATETKEPESEKKDEEKGAEVAKEATAEVEPETDKTDKTPKSKSNKKEKEPEAQAENAEEEKKFAFKSVKNPQKVEIANVEQIFSGSNFNYAVTKDQEIYSWGMGENYVLGNRNEDAAYKPTKLDADVFERKKIAVIGLGAQHVIVLGVDKDHELEEEAFAKAEDPSKSSKKGGTTGKKGEKKVKGKEEAAEKDEKDIKKNLTATLEEENEEKNKKGQKKSLKRKATDDDEEETGIKKVKKSPSNEKEKEAEGEGEKKAESKMEEEKPEKPTEEKEKIEEETTEAPSKANEADQAANEDIAKEGENGKMEEEKEKVVNKEEEAQPDEKPEEKPAEQAEAQPVEEEKKAEEQPVVEEVKKPEEQPQAETATESENKAREGTA